jgi:hypothetical protein
MADIDYEEYIDSFRHNFLIENLKDLPKLNLEQIEHFREPERKLLYTYYGHISQLDNYTIDQLNEEYNHIQGYGQDQGQDSTNTNVIIVAIISNNLKTIKYLHSRNIYYDFIMDYKHNIYYLAIFYGYLKIIKYYDSINISVELRINNKLRKKSYLEMAAISGSLKMIKYFELKAKDAPNFELEIIKCYINAATSNKNKIRIFKYLETKYPLYITNNIIYIAGNKAIDCGIYKAIKYLNRNNKYFNIITLVFGSSDDFEDYEENKACKFIKYLFSKITNLNIKYEEYIYYISSSYWAKKHTELIHNYMIKYKTKYKLCYFGVI